MSKMARHTRNNKNKKSRYSGNTISCPICGAEVIKVPIDQDVADIFLIPAGDKYVCSAKFIYRSNTSDLQFGKCYGIPVEGALRMLQLPKPFTKEGILELANQRLSQKYITSVISYDPFFKKIQRYLPKETVNEETAIAEKTDEEILSEIDELRGLDDE
jgi:hypothetical protein